MDLAQTNSEWVPLGELARIKGVSPPAISEKVRRLARSGLEIRKRGTCKLVNIEEFERFSATTADPARERRPSFDEIFSPTDPILSKEQARKCQAQADLAELERDALRRELLPAQDVRDAFTAFGGAVLRSHERYLNFTDELADAVGKHGAQGARNVLRKAIHEARSALTEDIDKIMDGAFAAREKESIDSDLK